jgi:hypothetical protein
MRDSRLAVGHPDGGVGSAPGELLYFCRALTPTAPLPNQATTKAVHRSCRLPHPNRVLEGAAFMTSIGTPISRILLASPLHYIESSGCLCASANVALRLSPARRGCALQWGRALLQHVAVFAGDKSKLRKLHVSAGSTVGGRAFAARLRLQRPLKPLLERPKERLLPAKSEVWVGLAELWVGIDAHLAGVIEERHGIEHGLTDWCRFEKTDEGDGVAPGRASRCRATISDRGCSRSGGVCAKNTQIAPIDGGEGLAGFRE